jgi:hypothetical protein
VLWGRLKSTVISAVLHNGLSKPHRDYLTAGGIGLMIGDGKLNHGPEQILETISIFELWEPFSITFDSQVTNNPAYNKDRGPVSVFACVCMRIIDRASPTGINFVGSGLASPLLLSILIFVKSLRDLTYDVVSSQKE